MWAGRGGAGQSGAGKGGTGQGRIGQGRGGQEEGRAVKGREGHYDLLVMIVRLTHRVPCIYGTRDSPAGPTFGATKSGTSWILKGTYEAHLRPIPKWTGSCGTHFGVGLKMTLSNITKRMLTAKVCSLKINRA